MSVLAQSSGSCPRTSAPRATVGDDRAQPADPGRDHGGPAGLRLGGDQPEGLAARGHRDEVGRAVPRRQLASAGHGRAQQHPAGEAEPGGEVEQLTVGTGPCRWSRRATTSSGTRPPRAAISASARTRTSGALSGWIRPANRTIDSSSGRPRDRRARSWAAPSPAPSSTGVSGEKRSRSTPGATTCTAARVGVVEVDEVGRLLGRARDERVGRRDHLVLADQPAAAAPARRRGRGWRSSPSPSCASCAPAARPSDRRRASRPARRASSGSGSRRTSRRDRPASVRRTPR